MMRCSAEAHKGHKVCETREGKMHEARPAPRRRPSSLVKFSLIVEHESGRMELQGPTCLWLLAAKPSFPSLCKALKILKHERGSKTLRLATVLLLIHHFPPVHKYLSTAKHKVQDFL